MNAALLHLSTCRRPATLACSALLTPLLAAGASRADTLHQNESVAGAATWTVAGNDHIVVGFLQVNLGATLTLEDCVRMRFDAAARMTVSGTLNAFGTPGIGGLFTRRDPTDEWAGIQFNGGASGALQYCTIEYATYGTGYGIRAVGASPIIDHCTLRANDYGMYASNVSPTFTNSLVTANNAYGIYLTGPCTPYLATAHTGNASYGNGGTARGCCRSVRRPLATKTSIC